MRFCDNTYIHSDTYFFRCLWHNDPKHNQQQPHSWWITKDIVPNRRNWRRCRNNTIRTISDFKHWSLHSFTTGSHLPVVAWHILMMIMIIIQMIRYSPPLQLHRMMILPTPTTVTAFGTTILPYRNVLYRKHHLSPSQQRYYDSQYLHYDSLYSHHRGVGTICRYRITQQQQRQRSYHTSFVQMMPEGPEIRTVVDQLQECIGQRLLK
jgi:hypothetical protein